MTLRAYIWGMRAVTILSFVALGAVVYFIDPESSAWVGLSLFYLAFFFSLGGLFNLFLLFLRKKLLGEETAAESVGLSFRQGILLSLIAIGILALQGFKMLVWWDALLLVGGVFLIELFFLSRE